jgi:hypothetical protein
MTPARSDAQPPCRFLDDYLQIALLLPILGFLPAIISWKCIEVALVGQWDPALLPGLAAAWAIPGWLVGWMWVAGRLEAGWRGKRTPGVRYPRPARACGRVGGGAGGVGRLHPHTRLGLLDRVPPRRDGMTTSPTNRPNPWTNGLPPVVLGKEFSLDDVWGFSELVRDVNDSLANTNEPIVEGSVVEGTQT